MNARNVSIVLVVLTLGLLAAVGYVAWRLQLDPETRLIRSTKVVTNTVTQIAVRKINATNLLAALASRPLNWAALESTNYAAYIANLRGFGCPEETVRDIIITDIAKTYARRRAALRQQFRPYQFWRTDDLSGYNDQPDLQRQLRDLDHEQRVLVKELLGVDYRREMDKYSDEVDAAYAFLPDEKQNRLHELQEKYREMEEEIHLRARGVLLEEDERALRKLRHEREGALAALLTPGELEEYQLRGSDTAHNLRTRLSGFEMTEDEFRQLFRLQKLIDDQLPDAFDIDDGVATAVKAQAALEAQAALAEEMREALGPERYAEFERAQDSDYQTLLQYAGRFDLSKETARRVHGLKREADKQRQAIESNPNLTDEQRVAAFTAIAREAEKETLRFMGEKAFKAYRGTAGEWLNPFDAPMEPSARQ